MFVICRKDVNNLFIFYVIINIIMLFVCFFLLALVREFNFIGMNIKLLEPLKHFSFSTCETMFSFCFK